MKSKHRLPIASLPIQTPDGIFLAHYSDKGLMRLDFPASKKPTAAWAEIPGVRTQISRWHKLTTRALKEALAAKPISNPPPYDLSDNTDFQRSVWAELEKIPIGETKTYGEVARELGNAKAMRAVGRGCGMNPIPILIPCHRLVAVRGKIGGFSGGLKWKEALLRREGVLFI
ncbi:MAG: methylated-DNA--[protein]-cysteine S-methyltransferase [Verrucomicrobiota bacterium]